MNSMHKQREKVLLFRINELEKICYTLSQSNRTLTDKL